MNILSKTKNTIALLTTLNFVSACVDKTNDDKAFKYKAIITEKKQDYHYNDVSTDIWVNEVFKEKVDDYKIRIKFYNNKNKLMGAKEYDVDKEAYDSLKINKPYKAIFYGYENPLDEYVWYYYGHDMILKESKNTRIEQTKDISKINERAVER